MIQSKNVILKSYTNTAEKYIFNLTRKEYLLILVLVKLGFFYSLIVYGIVEP